MRQGKRSIIIADREEIFRIGLQNILQTEDDLRVVDTASDGEEALRKTLRRKPDLLIVSDDVTRFHSLEILHRLYLSMSTTRVLIIGKADREMRRSAFRMGAYGYLLRTVGADELIDTIRRIMQGERIEADEGSEIPSCVKQDELLSVREMEVLKCITEGKSNQEIAAALYISEKTVKNHLTRIFRKMHVTDRTQAAITAIREKQIVLE